MQTFSVIFMIAAALVVIGVDVVLALNKYPGDTFSSILREQGRRHIALVIMGVFGMGLLSGHWWW